MAFIGNQPTAVPLTSSQLADGLITTAKLAADAVTSAKIADSTIVNADIASTTINLTQKVTGTLPFANGGTGLSTLGTSGQALVVNSSATALEYSTVGAQAGQVIQVLSATDSTQRTTTSTSFVTGSNTLSVTITPASTANKIYISFTTAFHSSGGEEVYLTLYRGATDLGNSNRGFTYMYGGSTANTQTTGAIVFLDSPNTNSATTYQVYFRTNSSAFTANLNSGTVKGSIIVMEVKG